MIRNSVIITLAPTHFRIYRNDYPLT